MSKKYLVFAFLSQFFPICFTYGFVFFSKFLLLDINITNNILIVILLYPLSYLVSMLFIFIFCLFINIKLIIENFLYISFIIVLTITILFSIAYWIMIGIKPNILNSIGENGISYYSVVISEHENDKLFIYKCNNDCTRYLIIEMGDDPVKEINLRIASTGTLSIDIHSLFSNILCEMNLESLEIRCRE